MFYVASRATHQDRILPTKKATTWIIKFLINHCEVNEQDRSSISRARSLTSFNAWTPCRSLSTSLPLQIRFRYSGRNWHPQATYAKQVACQAWNPSLVSVRVRLVRAASIPLCHKNKKYTWGGSNKKINAHKLVLCSTRAKHLRIDPALIPLMGFAA